MKTRFLNEFLVLAEQLNFSKAAKKLGINQSALSRHIIQLEKDLGMPLFNRTTQKIELTSYGMALLPHVMAILEQEESFECSVDAIRREAAHRLSLGVCGFPHYYGITAHFIRFKQEYQDAIIDVHEDSVDEMLGRLQSGILDAAFVHKTDDLNKEYILIPFREDHLLVSLPIAHPLAFKDSIHLNELKDEEFYIRSKKNTPMYNMEVRILSQAGFTPKISLDQGTWEDSIINRGDEVSLVNQGLADKLKGNLRVKVVEIEPMIRTDICLIVPKNRALPDMVSTFVKFTSEHPNSQL